MKQKTIFITAAVGLVLAFIVATLLFTAEKSEQASAQANSNSAALVRMHSPALGKPDAPVVIVEFLDPACGTCAAFYPLVKEMMAAHPGRIRLVMRYAPFHPGSDRVVAMLEAARKQGMLWPALEALLATQAQWTANHQALPDRAARILEGLGLDMSKLQEDAATPAIAAVIAQDLEDARTLNVTKTPEFFVNGQPLPRFGYEQLKDLVDEALRSAPR